MTSTPVGTPLKSDSLITYVGKSSANAMGSTQASFGAAFEKASNEHLGNAKQTTKENPSNPEVAKTSDTTKVDEETAKVSPEKEAKITENDEPMETEAKGALEIKEISPDKLDNSVKEAGEQLVEEIANTFEVDTEDVLEAMENLGLSFAALLQPEGLTSLVLAVSGEDQMALVSDEGLLENLNSLTEMADEMVANLSDELEVTKDAMQEILKLMDTTTIAPGTIMELGIGEEIIFENVGPMNENELGTIKEEMGTPVEEELEDENEVYEVNNHVSETINDPLVRMAVPTDKNESKERRSFEQNSSETFGKNIETLAINQDSPKEGVTGIDALFTDVNAQNNPELTATEQANVSYTQDAQTSEIMDQITEYMRVMVKAESTTMEMQLHPASLGSVNVSLTSKDGLLTAQFTAQNTLVKEVIESQMAALRESFEAQGIKVEAVEVTVASHAFERNLDGNNENRDNNSSDTKAKTGRTRKLRLEDLEDAEEELSEEDKLAADMMKQNGNTVDFTA